MTQKSTTAAASTTGAADFEHSLAELESIVARLEQGDLSLDESLQQFERGVGLTRICQNALQQAEQKIEILARTGGSNHATRESAPESAPESAFMSVTFQPDRDAAET